MIPSFSLDMLTVRRLVFQANLTSLSQAHELRLTFLIQIRKTKTSFLIENGLPLLNRELLRWIKQLVIAGIKKTWQHGLQDGNFIGKDRLAQLVS